MKMSESIVEISKALAKFQGEVVQPTKDSVNPHFKSKFTSLDNLIDSITKTSSKHGLSFLQFPLNEEDKVGVKTLLMHESGEWIEGDSIFVRPMKTDAQALGAVLTYLRRYSLSAIFGMASEFDDDAEGAMDRGNQASYNKQQPQQPQQPQQQQQYSNVISEAQIKLIGTLINKVVTASGMDKDMIVGVVKEKLKIKPEASTKELTKGQASGFINELQEMEKVYEG